ncbi:thioesterase family protein [Xanthocytophaga agilis]|uniref:Thioesterase family protein n=1 Tax=Xanthocytophaga agilis TaxID=3048010 RepID=A0AAE3UCG8_9BACT|nr:thioesterase family protein [Xanthocytophaga agilis]MDJ1499351.1 thioesterase family protein [Xanthocytophaga agilis]
MPQQIELENYLTSFRFRWKIQMRWSDMDEMKHVNNAVYLTYFEEARLRYLHETLQIPYRDVDTRVIIARNTVDYILPLFFLDEPYLYIRCTHIGTKSFELEQVIVNEKDGQKKLIAKGGTVMVTYNYKLNQSVAIPDSWREQFLQHEKFIETK